MAENNDNNISEQLRDDAAAFMLGAMSELEAQAFRREMMKNCELGRYVERLEQVGDVLLSQAPPVDVPDSLGMSIMAEAKRDLEVQELVASPRAGAPAEAPKKSLFDRILKPALAIGAAAIVAAGAFVVGQNAGEEQGQTAPTVAAEFKPNTDTPVTGTIQSIDGGATVEVSGLSPDIGSDVYELWIQRG